MASLALNRLQRAVINYVNSRNNTNQKSNNTAVQGRITGGKIMVGNKSYNADLAVDMAVFDGDTVWCVIDDSGTTAVIVGM